MILWYRNSFLASVVSIFGCVLFLGGIAIISEGDVGAGIVTIVLSIPLLLWAKKISNDKAFKKWWKQITDNNLEPQIAQNVSTAIAIYNKNPQKRTLDKIAQLNPAAAEQIRSSLEAKKAK